MLLAAKCLEGKESHPGIGPFAKAASAIANGAAGEPAREGKPAFKRASPVREQAGLQVGELEPTLPPPRSCFICQHQHPARALKNMDNPEWTAVCQK